MTCRQVLIAVLAVLVSLDLRPAGASATPRLGQPCRQLQLHPLTLGQDAGGTPVARFSFLDGAAQGTLHLSAEEADVLARRRAFVAEVRLGSYEPGPSGLTCHLDPALHLSCPATGELDQLCVTWEGPR